MTKKHIGAGDTVTLTSKEWAGHVGIVSQPISEASPGHVLVNKEGYILGISAALEDLMPADKSSEGYAQLAYNLIKLGSYVIEQGLL
jgi:hypothetical protein